MPYMLVRHKVEDYENWKPVFRKDHAHRKRRMNLGPHAAFIVAAYSSAIVILAALIGWIALDYRAQHRLLADLDRSGVKRRSRKKS